MGRPGPSQRGPPVNALATAEKRGRLDLKRATQQESERNEEEETPRAERKLKPLERTEVQNKKTKVAAPEYSASDGCVLFGAFNKKLRDAVDAIDIQQDIDAELNNAEVVFKLAQLVSSAYFLLQTAPADMCDPNIMCPQSVHQVRLAIQRCSEGCQIPN